VKDHPVKTGILAMTNATVVQIEPGERGTRGHDHAAEVLVGGETHRHVARARNIQHTVALHHLLHGMEMVRDTTRALIAAMGMVEVLTI
jgi:hypothetical protein